MFLDKFVRKCEHRKEINDYQTLMALLRYNLRESSPKHEEIMIINQQFNAIKRDFMHDMITCADYRITEKVIISKINTLVDELKQSDLRRKSNNVYREIRLPILVISSSTIGVEKNILLFDLLNFTKKEVVFTTTFHHTDAEIVVFDNHDIVVDRHETRFELMQTYVGVHKYVVHFGSHSEALDNYSNQVLQATSKIQLNAQLDMMVKFMDAYKT